MEEFLLLLTERECVLYPVPSDVRASTKRRRPLIRVLNASRMLRRPTKRRGRVCKSDPHDHAPTATLVFGMTRSGTSLATSIIAALLGGDARTWRGSGQPYPTDTHNVFGYFERDDVVRLNYKVLQWLGISWTSFQPGFHLRPHAINLSTAWHGLRAARAQFESEAERIAADMAHHSPFVLKDARFARTAPLWAPVLASKARLACVIPFRHPAEVALSSRAAASPLSRMRLWQSYILSALASAHAMRCPLLLLDYARWFNSSASRAAQLLELRRFLGVCDGSEILERRLNSLIRPEAKHNSASALRTGLPRDVACLFEALRSGKALAFQLDGKSVIPCARSISSTSFQ